MYLSKRPLVYALPSYSLTGDLLSFKRCGLQYRYSRVGHLPSTRPVQLWFGQFIHGVLEESYRRFDEARRQGMSNLPPWPQSDIDDICDLIIQRLASQGLRAWEPQLERLGRARAEAAINNLGPDLFPLIQQAEVRLTGTQTLPIAQIPSQFRVRKVDRYEMLGVIDVITHVQLSDPNLQNNRIVKAILNVLPPNPPKQFEVIIDYKGMRRPTPVNIQGQPDPLWQIYEWQVQTYVHLRSKQTNSLPVIAAILLYTNELLPTWQDLSHLKREIQNGTTDCPPTPGGVVEKRLNTLTRKQTRSQYPPKLSLDYRLKRALRVIPVDQKTISTALKKFDKTVADIEVCRGKEKTLGTVLGSWTNYAQDSQTCAACDHQSYCPGYRQNHAHGQLQTPTLPGIK